MDPRQGGGTPTRAFNGLNGAEVRKRILQEIEARLIQDTRLGSHLVFPVVTWTWTLELETYPASGALGPGGDGVLRSEIKGRVQVSNEDAALVELAPVVRESVLADAQGPRRLSALQERGDRANAPFRGDAELPRAESAADRGVGTPASVPPAVEARFARLEQLLERVAERVLTPVAIDVGGPAMQAIVGVTTGANPTQTTFHPDVPMHTGTGLPIRGGAKPSPGANLAEPFGGGSTVGVVQTAEAVKVAFGVQHPPLDEGGVGAPDAVRREAGLPIPTMTSTVGGVVDLPAGSF